MLYTIYLSLLCNFYINTRAEFFTAITDLEYLIETHQKVMNDLKFYIIAEEERITNLKRYLKIYETEHEEMTKDITNYLGNPINAFTLIKRLTIDLRDIKYNIEKRSETINKVTVKYKDLKYPSMDDLEGAALALARLQKVYNLDTHQLAEGKLNSVSYSTPLTASDCYELSHALMLKQTDFACEWMAEALTKYKEETISYPFNDVDIMGYISLAYFLLGDMKNSFRWTQKLLELDYEHPQAKDNLRYKDIFADGEIRVIQEEDKDYDDDDEPNGNLLMKVYEHLCRGEIEIPPTISRRFTCRYLSKNHPFLKIAPIKVETLYLDPDVVLFHDVLSDDEIETIKQMSKSRLQRAAVFSDKINSKVVDYRISKVLWLLDKESDLIAHISRRVMHMTGLSIETAAPLQVINYGIGGHYEPHYDFVRKEEGVELRNGNRIATVMFYMSNVAQGGATVFPWLGLTIYPVKGAAIFWENLHASGEGNLFTLHAACPVLQGSKWVSNKWLHLEGQEHLRPCNLKYEDISRPQYIPDFIFNAINS